MVSLLSFLCYFAARLMLNINVNVKTVGYELVHGCCPNSFIVSNSVLHDCKYGLQGAVQCIVQPNPVCLTA